MAATDLAERLAADAPLQLAGFAYGLLEPDDAAAARAAAERIRAKLGAAFVEVGRELIAVKRRLGHGHFGAWLRLEIGFSEATAQRCMRVAALVDGKSRSLTELPVTTLYALAAKSAPPEIVAEVVSAAQAGRPLSAAAINERLAGARVARRKPRRPKPRPLDAKAERLREARRQARAARRLARERERAARLRPLAKRVAAAIAPDLPAMVTALGIGPERRTLAALLAELLAGEAARV